MQVFSAQDPKNPNVGSYGSGTLLSADLVLTAYHVILPTDWAAHPKKLTITVRSAVEARDRKKWRFADLIWPSNTAWPTKDVALLRIRKPYEDPPAQISFGGEADFEEDNDYGATVAAVGFPEFAQRSEDDPRDTHRITGISAFETGFVHDVFKIDRLDLGHIGGNVRARANLPWAGFSGAGLFTRSRRLIGVVVAQSDGSQYDFRAERLRSLMLDPEFSKLFASGEINKFARAAPPIDQLVYLVDRDAQESAYARAYDSPSVMPRPRLPLVCVLPGAAEYRHAPDELPVRLAKKTLPEISTWPTNDSFVGLTWPDRSSSLEEGLADLRYGLWKALCGPAGASPPRDPNAYKALWSDDTRPRLLRSDLTQRPLNKWMAHLLSAWCSFLTAAAPAGERRITHLLMVSSTAEEVHRWRQRHRETIAHPVFALAELQQCNHSDLVDWLNDRLGKQLPGHQEKLISELGRRLLGQFRGPFFVDDLRASIRSALEAVRV